MVVQLLYYILLLINMPRYNAILDLERNNHLSSNHAKDNTDFKSTSATTTFNTPNATSNNIRTDKINNKEIENVYNVMNDSNDVRDTIWKKNYANTTEIKQNDSDFINYTVTANDVVNAKEIKHKMNGINKTEAVHLTSAYDGNSSVRSVIMTSNNINHNKIPQLTTNENNSTVLNVNNDNSIKLTSGNTEISEVSNNIKVIESVKNYSNNLESTFLEKNETSANKTEELIIHNDNNTVFISNSNASINLIKTTYKNIPSGNITGQEQKQEIPDDGIQNQIYVAICGVRSLEELRIKETDNTKTTEKRSCNNATIKEIKEEIPINNTTMIIILPNSIYTSYNYSQRPEVVFVNEESLNEPFGSNNGENKNLKNLFKFIFLLTVFIKQI